MLEWPLVLLVVAIVEFFIELHDVLECCSDFPELFNLEIIRWLLRIKTVFEFVEALRAYLRKRD